MTLKDLLTKIDEAIELAFTEDPCIVSKLHELKQSLQTELMKLLAEIEERGDNAFMLSGDISEPTLLVCIHFGHFQAYRDCYELITGERTEEGQAYDKEYQKLKRDFRLGE